ncbi:MAG: exodeoxyribonuclease I [Hydromonas sp.]|nr:exodeoxyribonuclease I [Hydromonas sp.]
MNAHPPLTFYWHDYETFGLSPAKDRPAQFAGVRTDMDFNPLGEPLMTYCQPMADYLPSPVSCLMTGITPQLCAKNGVPEPQFARSIHRQLAMPNTIGVGYNSLRFDDEVTRFMFWRNFIPPYQREFSNGCSRWDIIDMVRCVYALRPEGVVFPQDETGKVSLRLEKLSAANGLAHDAAHDALSDVQATIALAKLIQTAQPKLFEFCLNLRDKNVVQKTIGWPYTRTAAPKPLIHVSGMFGAERRFLAIVYPLAIHPVNKNELIVWDLAQDITPLSQLSTDEIRQRMFTSADELAGLGLSRLPIKTIHINKSPVVIAQLKTLNDTQAQACGVDWEVIEAHEAHAQAQFDALQTIDWQAVFAREYDDAGRSAEESLYGGAFISDADYRQANLALDAQGVPTGVIPKFKDARLTELWWRYRARFYPETLSVTEQAQWQEWRAEQLLGINGEGGVDALTDELNQLASEYAEQPEQLDILRAVHAHAQSLVEELEQ